MTELVYDVEGDGFLDELTTIWCIGIGSPEDGEVTLYADQPGYQPIKEGLKRLKEADRVIAHNGIAYDFFAVNKIYPGTLTFRQHYDTLVAVRLLDPEQRKHSLKEWGIRLGMYKGEHNDFSRFSKEMAEYCVQDVSITIKLYKKVRKELEGWGDSVQLEHEAALPIALQQQRGFRLDREEAIELEGKLRQERDDIERQLQEIYPPRWIPMHGQKNKLLWPGMHKAKLSVKVAKAGKATGKSVYTKGAAYCRVAYTVFNPGSRQQIEAYLREDGWRPTKFTKTGAAKLDDTVLNELAILRKDMKPLARYFRLSKQLGQLADGDNAWLRLARKVGSEYRVFGSVNPNGTVTGRMSHFSPNLGQVDKKDLRMRAVWIPGVGYRLVGVDAEGLELRVMAHYLWPYDNGEFAKRVIEGSKEDGTDVHTVNRKLIKMYIRDRAKRFVYAMLYGAGDPKLGLIIIQDADEAGKPRPKGSLTEIGRSARKRLVKGIKGLETVTNLTKKRHRKQGWLRGLDGRRVYTRGEHSALNTLFQSAGAIVMKKAMSIFHFETGVKARFIDRDYVELNDFYYVANVHDELQNEVVPEREDEFGELMADAIRLAGKRLGVRCPLSGSYDKGDNWKETH